MEIKINSRNSAYQVTIEEGLRYHTERMISSEGKTLILTDDGVPEEYVRSVAEKMQQPFVYRIPHGENNKSLDRVKALWEYMMDQGFTRQDRLVSVGGGMVGDLGGFAASCYMRGIDFYNVPTTLLAAVDASVGGKTAVNLCGTKNIIGAYWSPKAVLIDPDIYKALPSELFREGIAESIKMAVSLDSEFFSLFENGTDLKEQLSDVIYRSIMLKKTVIESDPFEENIRKVLNFGHTIGHAIEAASGGTRLHGECISIGMMKMCSSEARERLGKVLSLNGLPTENPFTASQLKPYIQHDKKRSSDLITTVFVPSVGSCRFENKSVDEIAALCE